MIAKAIAIAHEKLPQQNKETNLFDAGLPFDATTSLKYYRNAVAVKSESLKFLCNGIEPYYSNRPKLGVD